MFKQDTIDVIKNYQLPQRLTVQLLLTSLTLLTELQTTNQELVTTLKKTTTLTNTVEYIKAKAKCWEVWRRQ